VKLCASAGQFGTGGGPCFHAHRNRGIACHRGGGDGGDVSGLHHGLARAQFSSYQLAANAMAMQQMEQIVAAQWVVSGTSVTNIFSPSLTNTQINALCLPNTGTNLVYGTNYATVTQLSPIPLPDGAGECVWNFMVWEPSPTPSPSCGRRTYENEIVPCDGNRATKRLYDGRNDGRHGDAGHPVRLLIMCNLFGLSMRSGSKSGLAPATIRRRSWAN